MSFSAKLNVAGKEARVLSINYSLHREVDDTGRPSSGVKGGRINIEIESTDDNSLFEWMVDQFQTKDGSVTFMKTDQDSKMKELSWKKGYIVDYIESVNIGTDSPMTIQFTVSAEQISVAGANFKQPWPKGAVS